MTTNIVCEACKSPLGTNPKCGKCQKFNEFYDPDPALSDFDEDDLEDEDEFMGGWDETGPF